MTFFHSCFVACGIEKDEGLQRSRNGFSAVGFRRPQLTIWVEERQRDNLKERSAIGRANSMYLLANRELHLSWRFLKLE